MLDSTPQARTLKVFIIVVVVAANWIGGCFLAKFLLPMPKPSSFIGVAVLGFIVALLVDWGLYLICATVCETAKALYKYIAYGTIDGKVEKEQDYSAYEIEQATQELDAFLKEGR